MSKFVDGYSRAVRSKNLRNAPAESEGFSDSDRLAAAAFAGKTVREEGVPERRRPGNRLGVALMRLFVGGDQEAKEVHRLMAQMLISKAYHLDNQDRMNQASADLIAGLVLEWHRNSVCRTCGGHGYATVAGELGSGSRVVIGDSPCSDCGGTCKRPFDALFPRGRLGLALWLREEVEKQQAAAGVEAMRALGPQMDL